MAEAARGDRCAFDLGLGRFPLSLWLRRRRGREEGQGRWGFTEGFLLLRGGWARCLDLRRDSCNRT
jgi:hypothetical protein